MRARFCARIPKKLMFYNKFITDFAIFIIIARIYISCLIFAELIKQVFG